MGALPLAHSCVVVPLVRLSRLRPGQFRVCMESCINTAAVPRGDHAIAVRPAAETKWLLKVSTGTLSAVSVFPCSSTPQSDIRLAATAKTKPTCHATRRPDVGSPYRIVVKTWSRRRGSFEVARGYQTAGATMGDRTKRVRWLRLLAMHSMFVPSASCLRLLCVSGCAGRGRMYI